MKDKERGESDVALFFGFTPTEANLPILEARDVRRQKK